MVKKKKDGEKLFGIKVFFFGILIDLDGTCADEKTTHANNKKRVIVQVMT